MNSNLSLYTIGISLCILALSCNRDKGPIYYEPSVSTSITADVKMHSALSGGVVSDFGGSESLEVGVCWSTHPEPTVDDYSTLDIVDEESTEFSARITGLEPSTTYYARAYAVNNAGIGYGQTQSFTTLQGAIGSISDTDGNEYQIIAIGDQEWTTANLRTLRYTNGDTIGLHYQHDIWSTTLEGGATIYSPNTIDGIDTHNAMVDAYGVLYNWHAVADSRGLCPTGWRVPSKVDWDQLIEYLARNHTLYHEALLSCRFINSPLGGNCSTTAHPRWEEDIWSGNATYGTDDFGFSALPGGRRTLTYFEALGEKGYWWLTTESVKDTTLAYALTMWNTAAMFAFEEEKSMGHSVRCVRDR